MINKTKLCALGEHNLGFKDKRLLTFTVNTGIPKINVTPSAAVSKFFQKENTKKRKVTEKHNK